MQLRNLKKEYNILYLASGDPRNIITTVAAMEGLLKKVSRVNIHINDRNDSH
jgi:O-succinylbenzoate synthase